MVKPARKRTAYRCQSCGLVEPKWLGRCPGCEAWNTLVEEAIASSPSGGRGRTREPFGGQDPTPIDAVRLDDQAPRWPSGVGELDRVLGGGLVPGALVLLGGDPGIGKSTLLLQCLSRLAQLAHPVLYASGEESIEQTAQRAQRIGAKAANLWVHAETSLERILLHARKMRPRVLAIDSIQTTHTDELESVPGSLAQVRECAAKLMTFAKTTGTAVWIVGHVTKDGAIAGPKTLEHVVDTVLHFEGEGAHPYRILRALKNRFGSTREIGVFEMQPEGLIEVASPSQMFLAERPVGAPGSVVVASADGARPILVEVQALVAPPTAALGRRTAAGVDTNRVALLLAVLAERAHTDVLSQDVFVNVAGGVRLNEPAVDLGIACAIASAERREPVFGNTLVFGEVGLAGEVRAVSLADARLAEAKKLGFARVILPRQNAARAGAAHGLDLVGVSHLREALAALFAHRPA